MTHPLTDEIIDEINEKYNLAVERSYDEDMRAAYDLAVERMSQWIEENGYEYVAYDDDYGCQTNFSQMIKDFKKAMRPQEDN